MLGIVILRTKTFRHMQSEIARLNCALATERKKCEALTSGCKKQLAEKDRLIKELTEAVNKIQH